MAVVTLTITLPDHEAHALAITMAGLGPEQFESAYQHWLIHWKASDAYSPQVEASGVTIEHDHAASQLATSFRMRKSQTATNPPTCPGTCPGRGQV
jgi:hypothetical protein